MDATNSPDSSDKPRDFSRALGLGLITGAADDDCSAIGTYASSGAQFGYGFLWMAPVTFPMMFAVVYLSAKLGRVAGKGLFAVLREHFTPWLMWPALIGVLIGNVIEAGANIGAMAATINLFVAIPHGIVVPAIAGIILVLQVCGSYALIRNVFRWLALSLFAYVGSAALASPDPWAVLRGTFVPEIQFSKEFLSMLVAVIGTTLSAYLYTWQSNVEVEELIAAGRMSAQARRAGMGTELAQSRRDILVGMAFSNVIMYFIILSTGATLHKAGQSDISTAAQAAEALKPLAGNAASALFSIGIIAVGFLAVPVMTTGAAYDLCQTLGWKSSLNVRPKEAHQFYLAIAGFTAAAVLLNFLGFNPMKALIYSGIVQGFSTPPLLLLILLMTSDHRLMGSEVNSAGMKALGWLTVSAIFAATAGLVASWIIG
ncbi:MULTISPECIES: NRAMP family divalent metal transporter [unclassified Bradyrhizobium]|uniref:NRAMP family divalent metal transporter n=1 Tax=unclassified Bradyrhizobium TaxID=2631580 RepID=UPI00211566CE|nr:MULTISPECIES: divalent metal cation transporter [unclassified Bradyrhizobium]